MGKWPVGTRIRVVTLPVGKVVPQLIQRHVCHPQLVQRGLVGFAVLVGGVYMLVDADPGRPGTFV